MEDLPEFIQTMVIKLYGNESDYKNKEHNHPLEEHIISIGKFLDTPSTLRLISERIGFWFPYEEYMGDKLIAILDYLIDLRIPEETIREIIDISEREFYIKYQTDNHFDYANRMGNYILKLVDAK